MIACAGRVCGAGWLGLRRNGRSRTPQGAWLVCVGSSRSDSRGGEREGASNAQRARQRGHGRHERQRGRGGGAGDVPQDAGGAQVRGPCGAVWACGAAAAAAFRMTIAWDCSELFNFIALLMIYHRMAYAVLVLTPAPPHPPQK